MTEVTIFEMGPRDGLQNESKIIATDDKVRLVNALSNCGFQKIEVTSFVSAKWVPQMADASEVLSHISRRPNVRYTALTPNLVGFEKASLANVDEVAIFASASEGFSQKNINCSIDESFERFIPVLNAARTENIPVRGYISCITDCPYDGSVASGQVVKVAQRLLALGCYEISLGDTIGAATPAKLTQLLTDLFSVVEPTKLAGHFHDTNGHAIANIAKCLDNGLTTFDAAIGGLGGCPFAPGAKGNVATEKVHHFLVQQGCTTGLDEAALVAAAALSKELI